MSSFRTTKADLRRPGFMNAPHRLGRELLGTFGCFYALLLLLITGIAGATLVVLLSMTPAFIGQ